MVADGVADGVGVWDAVVVAVRGHDPNRGCAVVTKRKTLLFCFQKREGWYICRPYDEVPLGPYKSPEQALDFYAKGRDLTRYKVIEGGMNEPRR